MASNNQNLMGTLSDKDTYNKVVELCELICELENKTGYSEQAIRQGYIKIVTGLAYGSIKLNELT